MADRFYRLVTFIINVCPLPLRELFLKHAKSTYPTTSAFTIHAYIKFRHHDIAQIKSLTRDQKDLLFHIKPVNIDDWDSTLLILLLTELFENKVRPLIGHLKLIKEHRNELLHFSSTETLDEEKFNSMWDELTDSTLSVAEKARDVLYKQTINDQIKEVSINNMPDLGDVLRKWYDERIVCLENDFKVLESKLLDVCVGTDESNEILKSTSWDKHTKKTGATSRRWKTVNAKVKHMQESFHITMDKYKEDDSCDTSQTNDVLAQLRSKHFSVVSGHCEETYSKVAFTAVAQMAFPYGTCLLIDNPADWAYVLRLDTDIVVFCHPFGKGQFEMKKAKVMFNLQDTILQLDLQEINPHLIVNIIILTDHAILNEYKSYFGQRITSDAIEINLPTSEHSPVDLTYGDSQLHDQQLIKDQYLDFVAQSKCLMRFKKEKMGCLLQSDLRQAKEIFKTNKSLVIVGKQRCGKTSLALTLLQSYNESHCLLLTEPDEVRYVRLGETCVVLIDHFTGKYLFDMSRIESWFRKFDVLLAAVKNRQLNVIITSDEARFNRCRSEFHDHPILQHVIKLEKDQRCIPSPPQTPIIKTDTKTHYTMDRRGDPSGYLEKKLIDRDTIQDICYNCDGTFLVSSSRDVSLIKSDMSILAEFNNVTSSYYIIISSNSSAFYAIGSKIILYEINGGKCSSVFKQNLKKRALSASTFNDEIFILDTDGKLSVFSTRLKFDRTFDIPLITSGEILSSRVCIVALHEVIFLLKCYVYCINLKKHKIRYFSEDKFVPLSMCRCNDCSVFVIGTSNISNNTELVAYQLNSKLEILSKIVLKDVTSNHERLSDLRVVFDTKKSRLIILNKGVCSDVIYMNS